MALISSALVQYPDPPARTNHSLGLGELPGLWAAAQHDLRLAFAKGAGTAAAGPATAAAPAAAAAQTPTEQPCSSPQPLENQKNAAESEQASGCRSQAGCNSPACGGIAGSGHMERPSPAFSCSGRSFDDCWRADGAGPSAATLLAKLRWATLGPQYNWTTRAYEPAAPHRPLPPALGQLAVRLAAAATAVTQQYSSAACWAANAPSAPSAQPPGARPYAPDAALVNYYREGDTLGGHQDDVERDMTQPIVSLSLGCDAVFLMGGPTRDEPPTALRLRSGDALVLAWPARMCYHGVPRVLAGTFVAPPAAEPAAEDAALLQHMARCRVNISIRAVA